MAAQNRHETTYDELQEYVDKTLDDKRALRLRLRAQADPQLERSLETTREFFVALDEMPLEEPSANFDARILASVPLQRYATAPRRAQPVIVVGDLAPSAWIRALKHAGRGALAVTVAYFGALVVGSTALAGPISRAAAASNLALADFAGEMVRTPVIGPVVGALSSAYDAVGALLAGAGAPVAILIVGGVVGGLALAAFTSSSRRRSSASVTTS